ncbi:uncharacterized protein LOC119090879 [Pollicipes pollicipes]|uniref:uncharacterized protein LOC119090879 n=1 Tax=Pollicipes pollicipes TaxID=41117 RepID=UPI001884EA94|nr:uncharacterized protein LOC119090879 [Pollicipes pollicipes]
MNRKTTDGATTTAGVPRLAAPHADGASSGSDSSSSLYAETEPIDCSRGRDDSPATSDAASRATLDSDGLTQHLEGEGRPRLGRTLSLGSVNSAYGTPGASRHNFSSSDAGGANAGFAMAPTDDSTTRERCPTRRRRSEEGARAVRVYLA